MENENKDETMINFVNFLKDVNVNMCDTSNSSDSKKSFDVSESISTMELSEDNDTQSNNYINNINPFDNVCITIDPNVNYKININFTKFITISISSIKN